MLVVFKKRKPLWYSPAVYIHHGKPEQIAKWLHEATPTLRYSDCEYACARFVAFASERIPGHLGVGVLNFDPADKDSLDELIEVDVVSGKVTISSTQTHRAKEKIITQLDIERMPDFNLYKDLHKTEQL